MGPDLEINSILFYSIYQYVPNVQFVQDSDQLTQVSSEW